ncbi:MAG TPA: hypothetical protein VNA65_11905 [Candidatus Dormibacteraeota bacterium]|nr:hypothetical protein [Candidatus Dormibacteraeota bacterium]
MELTRTLVCVFACLAVAACGQSAPSATSSKSPPSCAGTFAAAITSADPTPGVWDCLSAAYQNRLQGEGDGVFALETPLWTHPHYLGLDRNIALFDMTVNRQVEPAVYNPPVTHVVMAVYLDQQGRVDHAKAATPTG